MNIKENIDKVVRCLSGSITITDISKLMSDDIKNNAGTKRQRSAFRELISHYKYRKNYGYMGSAIIMSLIVEGSDFMIDLERKGIFLCGEHVEDKFKNILSKLKDAQNNDEHNYLRRRLHTYLNYCDFVSQIEGRIIVLKSLLQNRSQTLIKALLGLAELQFQRKYFDLDYISSSESLIELLARSRNPEEFAALISHLIWMANSINPLKGDEFETPLENELTSNNLIETLKGGYLLKSSEEIAKAISCFGYVLEKIEDNNCKIFKIIPPSQEFEMYLRLGYIRNEIIKPIPRIKIRERARSEIINMKTAAEYLLQKNESIFAKWINFPFPRVVFQYPDYVTKIVNKTVFEDDILLSDLIQNEFMIDETSKDIFINKNLNLYDFIRIYRCLLFFLILDSTVIGLFKKKYNKMSLNSLVRVANKDQFINKTSEVLDLDENQFKAFMELISWKSAQKKYFDMQYQPYIEVDDKLIFLPAIFSTTNIFRNVQVSNKIRVRESGKAFTKICKEEMQLKVDRIISEKKVKKDNLTTEIDIIAWMGNTLYLLECKYSLPPCDYQEMRDIWEEILKGVEQLNKAKAILSDQDIRLGYLTGWFPGTAVNETENIEIKSSVIVSHRLFAGMEIDEVPIRDYYSLSGILTEYVISTGMLIPGEESRFLQYSSVQNGKFSKEDFDNYLSRESRIFKMYTEQMSAVTNYDVLIKNKLIVAWETFLYSRDEMLEETAKKMDKLGFHRLPDKVIKLDPPKTLDEIIEMESNK